MKVIAGTDKGLLVYTRVNGKWKVRDIHFTGMPVGYFHHDPRSGAWWVAVNHRHWGPKLYRSFDEGETFREVACPRFSNASGLSVKAIWTIAHSPGDPEGKLYAGVEPAAIFITEDQGQNFRELEGLSNHSSRPAWQGGGKGSKNPFLHTILADPEDPDHLLVGISCAGVFQSYDAGQTWKPTNSGLDAFYLPNQSVAIGHDPHTIRPSKQNPNVLWQQNHCGIYRSEDKGLTWQNITDRNGRANYGFALVVDDSNDHAAWVIPAQSDSVRIPHHHKLAVYHTRDGGLNWQAQCNGLPQQEAFDLVLRAAFDGRRGHLAFGTNNGNLYYSPDRGASWQAITRHLSTVRVVRWVD